MKEEARKEVGILWCLGSMFQEQGGGWRRGKKCAVGVICGDCLLCWKREGEKGKWERVESWERKRKRKGNCGGEGGGGGGGGASS